MTSVAPLIVNFLKHFQTGWQTATSRAPVGPPLLCNPCGALRLLIIQQLKGSYQILQDTARSLPRLRTASILIGQCPLTRAYASPYLEVAPDKLSHGVVIDIQGQCDTGLSLEPGSPHGGHPGQLGWPEACGERRA